jgi:uncharacterized protein (TIGR02217 family)
VTLANGFEERNTPWAHSRRRYDAGVSLRSLDDVDALIAFYEARRGQLFGFRWKDWSDFKSCLPSKVPDAMDQLIGLGNGAQRSFGLVKTYASGSESYTRPITKPVLGTVLVAISGDPKVETIEFDIDTSTGIVTFPTPPDEGVRITAGYQFDVPVRFDTDRIQASVASFKAGDVPSVPVMELRL